MEGSTQWKTAKFFQARASLSGGLPELGREVGGIGVVDRRPNTPNSSFIDYVPWTANLFS